MLKLEGKMNLSEPTFSRALVAKMYADDDTEQYAEVGEVFWRFADEPNAGFQKLGEARGGSTLEVPFDTKGRAVDLRMVSRTPTGKQSVLHVREGLTYSFTVPEPPVISNISFDDVEDEVTLTIANNGGVGSIFVMRRLGGAGDFATITSIPNTQTTYIDEPPIDGTYYYKLIQRGIAGESNTVSIVVDVGSAGTGSAPSGLGAIFDNDFTTNLSWTNNGGTGSNVIERKTWAGFYAVIDSVASGATSFADNTPPGPTSQILTYRVKNESADGYSNESSAYIPKIGGDPV